MMLFTVGDQRIDVEVEADADNSSSGADSPDDEAVQVIYQYAAEAHAIRDPLEFLGFTLPVVRQQFEQALAEKLQTLGDGPGRWFSGLDSTAQQRWKKLVEREQAVLQTLTFEDWLATFKSIWELGLRTDFDYWYAESESQKPVDEGLSELTMYMLSRAGTPPFGFPGDDYRAFIRAALEVVDDDEEVIYDLTELLADEYLSLDEDLCSWARWAMAEEFVQNHKVVVLTEGKSDANAISRTLNILFPHLAEYYSFMDFEGARVAGGAGALVSTVKAFVGAGILNRIVALFDNDTAAQSALRGLRDVRLPENVRIVKYPALDFAREYPTIGPQGITIMDVNGLAGSLELYFGLDVLSRRDGTFTPVQWRGYDDGMQRYQGELLEKGELQTRFFEKLKLCEEDHTLIDSYDWTGMCAILERLRTAFH